MIVRKLMRKLICKFECLIIKNNINVFPGVFFVWKAINIKYVILKQTSLILKRFLQNAAKTFCLQTAFKDGFNNVKLLLIKIDILKLTFLVNRLEVIKMMMLRYINPLVSVMTLLKIHMVTKDDNSVH